MHIYSEINSTTQENHDQRFQNNLIRWMNQSKKIKWISIKRINSYSFSNRRTVKYLLKWRIRSAEEKNEQKRIYKSSLFRTEEESVAAYEKYLNPRLPLTQPCHKTLIYNFLLSKRYNNFIAFSPCLNLLLWLSLSIYIYVYVYILYTAGAYDGSGDQKCEWGFWRSFSRESGVFDKLDSVCLVLN